MTDTCKAWLKTRDRRCRTNAVLQGYCIRHYEIYLLERKVRCYCMMCYEEVRLPKSMIDRKSDLGFDHKRRKRLKRCPRCLGDENYGKKEEDRDRE